MKAQIKAINIKRGAADLARYIPLRMATTAWSYVPHVTDTAVLPDQHRWQCMFSLVDRVAEGAQVCFFSERCGCRGAACYFGFKKPAADAGRFPADVVSFSMPADRFIEMTDNISGSFLEQAGWLKLTADY
jgi:hypothetical protein